MEFGTTTSHALLLTTGDTERMRIDSAGHVSIGGTTNASGDGLSNLTLGNGSGDAGLSIYSGTSSTSRLMFADGTSGGSQYDGFVDYNHSNQSLGLGTGATGGRDVTIGSGGAVSIGTTTTDRELKVQKSGDHSIIAAVSGTSNLAGMVMGDTSDDDRGAVLYNNNGDYMYFQTDTAERMRIDSSGNLIIGTTNSNPVNLGNHRLVVELNSSTAGIAVGADGLVDSRQVMTFYNDNGTTGTIITSGSSTSYNTSSDYRLKENVDYEFNALDRVAQLKPARFNFIADADTTVDGFLAHEVSDIVPEAISGEKDAVKEEEYEINPPVLDDDGNVVTEAEMGTREVPDYQGIDQSKLVPLLTKAIQEQQELINNLTARIEQLEN